MKIKYIINVKILHTICKNITKSTPYPRRGWSSMILKQHEKVRVWIIIAQLKE